MNCKTLLTLSLPLFIFLSCNSAGESNTSILSTDSTNSVHSTENYQAEQEPIPVGKTLPAQDSPIALSKSQALKTRVDWDKKIIKTATLKFEVKDFNRYSAGIYASVKQLGGYIATETQSLSEEKLETTVTIKVPVEAFELMMNQLMAHDVKVIERQITSEDVSSHIVDKKSRLEAKKQMREKYLEFFKQAKNMEEVLKVQTEINELQESMESAAGRVNYLTHQSAMSTIVLSFYQPKSGYILPDKTPSFTTRIAAAFKSGGNWIGDLLVGMITIWPLLLIIIFGLFLFRKYAPSKIKQSNS